MPHRNLEAEYKNALSTKRFSKDSFNDTSLSNRIKLPHLNFDVMNIQRSSEAYGGGIQNSTIIRDESGVVPFFENRNETMPATNN